MADILHTPDQAQADLLCAMLRTDGIDATIRSDSYMGRYVVHVADERVAAAVAVRKRFERDSASPVSPPAGSRAVIIGTFACFVALWALWYWRHR